jgi:hypothetical protein
MNKTELLDYAVGLGNSPRPAIKLAWNSLSDERIDRRRATAQKFVTSFNLGTFLAQALSIVLVFCYVANFIYTGEESHRHSNLANVIAAVSMGGFAAFLGFWVLEGAAGLINLLLGHARTVELLAPTAGSDACERGVKALTNGGQKPAQWRDAALQERSQLYEFDVRIMEALARDHVAAIEKAKRDAELAAACRVLHGVPSSATVGLQKP